MKLIIAAPPRENRLSCLVRAIGASGLKVEDVTEVVTDCRDGLASTWATCVGVPIHVVPARPETYGLHSSKTRNVQMCTRAEAILAITDGKPGNVRHLLQTAERMGLHVMTYPVAP